MTALALPLLAWAQAGIAIGADGSDRLTSWTQSAEQDGVRAELSLNSSGASSLVPGGQARLRVVLTTTLDGSPLGSVLPGAWIDSAAAPTDRGELEGAACQQRITRYLRASGVGAQAFVDLNGYDVLVMNADASISVLDPRTQFAGRTSMRTELRLPAPGFDWAASRDDTRLFVTIPSRRLLAIADLTDMSVVEPVALPGSPGRVVAHPDGKHVWVGVPATGVSGALGGVAIVQAAPPYGMHWIALGRGHADMAFDPAGWAAVSHRDDSTLYFVDPTVQRRVHQAALPVGAMAMGVVFDATARRFIVADARGGRLLPFDHRGQPLAPLALQPGIGPMRISPDGRWLFVANPSGQHVDVVDLVAWRAAHRLQISGRPYEVSFTDAYAYVRALDSEAVVLVALPSLETTPRLQVIAIGERAPARSPNLPIASPLVAMPDRTGSFVVSPGDNAIYYYMEGMNAPAGSISARGHEARAVRVARRGLREISTGVFEALLMLPGTEDLIVSVATDSPRTRLCLPLTLPAPAAKAVVPWQLTWDLPSSNGEQLALRILGVEPARLPQTVALTLFQPGAGRLAVAAERQLDGRYVAVLPSLPEGVWYAHAVPPVGSGAKWPYTSFQRRRTTR